MNKTIKLLPIFALLMFVSTACQITPERAQAICPQVERIAERTVKRVLKSNNNDTTRKAIQTAVVILTEAYSNPTLTFNDLAGLIGDLPFDKLQDEGTQLYVDGATLAVVLLLPSGAELDISKHESAQVIAACIAAGLQRGLEAQ